MSTWASPHLGAVLCGDLLLTGSTVFYLLRHSKTVLPRGLTAPILSSLRRVTIQASRSLSPRQNVLLIINTKRQSAAPPAVCALLNFIATVLLYPQPANTPVSSTISSGWNTVLPQLYVWAAMWTLNYREDIFAADNNQCTLHPELRATSDSDTVGHPAHAGGGNKLIDFQREDKLISLGATEKLQQNLRPDGVSSRLMV
ncbi:hypothetical protein B0H19DRAFT_1268475 [Mycena capillaripes]|nr:hypothetical protein B0H19DRAFT_1268475 [Mycena capillaripes]